MSPATNQNINRRAFSPSAPQFISLRDKAMGHREGEARARIDNADDLRGPVPTSVLPALAEKISKAPGFDFWRPHGASHANGSPARFGERAMLASLCPSQAVHECRVFARRAVGMGPGSGL